MRTHFTILVVSLVAVLTPLISVATTYHVPDQFPTIQAAIDAAVAGDVVAVAPGTYHDCTHKLNGLTDFNCIVMKSRVSLVSDAGPAVTIIDAQSLGRVMVVDSCGQGTRIEGFTLTGGKISSSYGSGLRCTYSDAQCVNLTITNNSTYGNGGGTYVHKGASHFQNCVMKSNHAGYYGGGLHCLYSAATFDDCSFNDNSASSSGGGVVCDFYEYNRHPTFTRCLIARNTAITSGGGIWTSNSSYAVFNFCTVSGNTCGNGASFYSLSTNVMLYCCILSFGIGPATFCGANDAFQCCDVFGNTGGDSRCGKDLGGNFASDPLFVDKTSGNFELSADSPCRTGNHPTGCNDVTIGAFSAGTPVQRSSWGSIKALYHL